MKRLLVAAAVLAAFVGSSIVTGQMGTDDGLSVRVVGLRVAAESYGDDMMMQPFNAEPGAALAVLVESRTKAIIEFDDEVSQLTSFTDDKGTDLRAPKATMGMSFTPTFGFPRVSDDGKAALFELRGSKLPAADSSKLKAEGAITLVLGTEKARERQKNVPLSKGSKITVGPVPLEILEVSPGGDWGGAMTVKLRANADISTITGIRFYDTAGREVESDVYSTMTSGMMGRVQVVQEISLERKVSAADIEIEYWKGIERKQVPFTLEAGLALK